MEKQKRELPPFLGKLNQAIEYITSLEVPVHAAHASYFIILAVVPLLLLILSLLRYTDLGSGDLLAVLQTFVPAALMPTVQRLVEGIYDTSSMAVVSASAVAALWAASRGMFALLHGLNRIYGVKETRGYVVTRLLSLFYTILFVLMVVLTLGLHVFGEFLLEHVSSRFDLLGRILRTVLPMRFVLLLVLQLFVFTAMFVALPNRRNSLLGSLPGALTSSFGWLIFSDLFSLYVERFSNASRIYGSLTTVALGMLWLYACISIVFYGGVLNRYLQTHWETLERSLRRK